MDKQPKPQQPAQLARLVEARASDAAWTRAVAAELALRMQHARTNQRNKGRA